MGIYYPTVLRGVQITPKTNINITRRSASLLLSRIPRKILPHGHNNLGCWIINLLLDVLLCSIAEDFYLLFIFSLALRVPQNTAQLVKILIDTTQQNV